MNYTIQGLCPASDMVTSAWGFSILLHPAFKADVAKSGIDRTQIETAIENMGRFWLDGCGYSSTIDHGEGPVPLYTPNLDLRVSWGEWGPEHISVPGDACGLDLNPGFPSPPDGASLCPHNVDSMRQAMLLLIIFTWFAESITILASGS